ncbi:MAG: hypothetical protein ACI8TQ_001177 [Planctomycetota bacterium]
MTDTPQQSTGQASELASPQVATLSPQAKRTLEILGVILILIAAMVPRMRDFGEGFDREFDGAQGASFAIFAVNYERLGVGTHLGYPVHDVDLVEDMEANAKDITLYANHPPAVSLTIWLAAKLMGPAGWNEAWKADRAPEGLAPVMRMPFLLAHLGSLVLLYLVVRSVSNQRRAMIALAVMAAIPVSIIYATIVNYENPVLLFVLAAAFFHVRFLQRGKRADLIGFGLCALFGCATTFFHVFYLPGLTIQAFLRNKRRAIQLAVSAIIGLLVPLVAHAVMSARSLANIDQSPSRLSNRINSMLEPLFDGSIPITQWASYQWERSMRYFSEPILIIAVIGVALALISRKSPQSSTGSESQSSESNRPIELTIPLLSGGLLLMFVMYRHTADGWNGGDGQVPFLMYLTPGVALAASLFFDKLSTPLAKLRGGIAPLVIAVSLVCVPGLERANELRRPIRAPGPRDDPALTTGPAMPLPSVMGREIAPVIPAGEFAICPLALGLTPAALYYSWRTIIPVDPEFPATTRLALAKIAARGKDAWLLLPREQNGAIRTTSDQLFAIVKAAVPAADRDQPDYSNEHWMSWRLPSK